jgi:hypothetical protein
MALTSPARMELCRHLLGEPITTSELAARLGSSEPQVSRALRTLRDAGLCAPPETANWCGTGSPRASSSGWAMTSSQPWHGEADIQAAA